jgi:hypothetical protein
MWILAALGFCPARLNVNAPALRYATNAVYPFYILHQIIVMLLCRWSTSTSACGPNTALVLLGTALVTWELV